MGKRIYITGIGTDVGKTIVSAIVTEALEADYWKPIQAGDIDYGDTEKVMELISNKKSISYPNAYLLNTPMSPHAAAKIDGVKIELDNIKEPETHNHLVIEGAGGLLVPLNNENTILDTINIKHSVILVSRHYLGSINHTLMSIELLKNRNHKVSIIFNGPENKTTESIISKMTNINVIGRIDEEKNITKKIISKYAKAFKANLNNI